MQRRRRMSNKCIQRKKFSVDLKRRTRKGQIYAQMGRTVRSSAEQSNRNSVTDSLKKKVLLRHYTLDAIHRSSTRSSVVQQACVYSESTQLKWRIIFLEY
jgi:hypothetical protein